MLIKHRVMFQVQGSGLQPKKGKNGPLGLELARMETCQNLQLRPSSCTLSSAALSRLSGEVAFLPEAPSQLSGDFAFPVATPSQHDYHIVP
jgi:hypothetical protein